MRPGQGALNDGQDIPPGPGAGFVVGVRSGVPRAAGLAPGAPGKMDPATGGVAAAPLCSHAPGAAACAARAAGATDCAVCTRATSVEGATAACAACAAVCSMAASASRSRHRARQAAADTAGALLQEDAGAVAAPWGHGRAGPRAGAASATSRSHGRTAP
ncbi:mRNA decay activator protein ZFP36L3-like [Panicum virgatum]|uniref:mRNA decay activator protein ZFP36L3-like n=1 Tax=Panicum virgatum TaxID=38727 RepID=UPI0019D5B34D|nr:mRNA decay activator protein ZFP36L3-like [Panicum virgatum]